MEARFIKSELERKLGAEVFLDSDDLKDLRQLGQHVVGSDALFGITAVRHLPAWLYERAFWWWAAWDLVLPRELAGADEKSS